MDFDDYQEKARSTAVYPRERRIDYPMTMIAGEAGELVGRYGKILRGDDGTGDPAKVIARDPELHAHLVKEIGDILWGLAVLSGELGVSFDEVAQQNLEKLQDRQRRDVLKGSGDTR